MNKKIYVKPLVVIEEIEAAEMICTSGTIVDSQPHFEEWEEEEL